MKLIFNDQFFDSSTHSRDFPSRGVYTAVHRLSFPLSLEHTSRANASPKNSL